MKSRSCRLAVEALEDRCVPSTVVYADFNHDLRADKVELTNPTTITVSLAKPDGSYAVSAILTVPKSLPIGGVSVDDYNGDGNMDISAGGFKDRFYNHTWLGNGDGTFDARDTQKSAHFSKWFV